MNGGFFNIGKEDIDGISQILERPFRKERKTNVLDIF
jgi:hypothetical protein